MAHNVTLKQSPLELLINNTEIDHIARAILDNSPAVPRVFAEIHVTDHCNSACRFCNQRTARRRESEMAPSMFEHVIKDLSYIGLRGVRLSGGGEPTAHPQFIELLRILRQNRIQLVNIDTNGLLLGNKMRKAVLNCKPRTVHISLLAPDGKRWSQETGIHRYKYRSLISNVEALVKEAESTATRVEVSFVIDEITYDTIPKMEDLANKLGVDFFIHDLNSYSYSRHFLDHCIPVVNAALNHIHEDTVRRRFYIKNLTRLELARKRLAGINAQRPKELPTVCLAPWCATMIRPDGTIFPCCAIMDLKNPLSSIGMLPLREICTSQRFLKMQEEARQLFLFKQAESEPLQILNTRCIGRCGPKEGLYSHPALSQRLLQSEGSAP